MIFGNFGCPELGVKGAALASTLSDVIGMLSMLFLFKMDKENRLFGLGFFNGKSTKNILKVSSPLMVQGSIALGTWTLFFMMIEQRGVFEPHRFSKHSFDLLSCFRSHLGICRNYKDLCITVFGKW